MGTMLALRAGPRNPYAAGMSGTIHKELQPLAKAAREAGWTIEVTKGNHLRWTSPDGQRVTCAMTPSSHRTRVYVARDLRRAGLDLPRA